MGMMTYCSSFISITAAEYNVSGSNEVPYLSSAYLPDRQHLGKALGIGPKYF